MTSKNKTWLLNRILIIVIATFSFFSCGKNEPPINVLLIIVDDLRPELNCYGESQIISLNIDQLAKEGILFHMAYAQQALCTPSRTSFLTGYRPETIHATRYDPTHFREYEPELVTLPQLFKNHGYQTYSFGKVFHHRDSVSWSEKSWVPESEIYPLYTDSSNLAIQRQKLKNSNRKPQMDGWWAGNGYWLPANSWEAADVSDHELFDGMITDKAIEQLRQIEGDPFFMAVGYFRPHIPFIAPKKYFDRYALDQIEASNYNQPPENVPAIALTDWGETRAYIDIPREGPITETKAKELLRGYYASVSYVDAQIGRLLGELKKQKVLDNTIVVFYGDHGYHLGDLGLWGKYTNFENATRVPFIIRYPKKVSAGSTNAIVELVDVYPTLTALAGLPLPDHLQGESLIPVLENPALENEDFALSQYPRGEYMGYSIRKDSFRYTSWISQSDTIEEFYQYQEGQFAEESNLANHPSFMVQQEKLKDELLQLLKAYRKE